MLFAILSLLMGHWIVYISKICVKSSAISSRFYPCSIDKSFIVTEAVDDRISFNNHSNYSVSRQLLSHTHTQICPEVGILVISFNFYAFLPFRLFAMVTNYLQKKGILVILLSVHLVVYLSFEPNITSFIKKDL